MRGPKALFEAENNLVTDMGAWFPGERVVFRGKDLHHDLADLSWMELYLFGITGRRFDVASIELFNAIWVLTSYPDPRLWNNRVSHLTASARSTAVLGLAAGIAVSEAQVYGGKPEIYAYDLICTAAENCPDDESLVEYLCLKLASWRAVPGYGRPITYIDERLEPFFRKLENSHKAGKNVDMAQRIETILEAKGYPFRLNYAGLTAAAAADLGLSCYQFYLFCSLAFVGGMLPSFCGGNARAAGAFFPVRCSGLTSAKSPIKNWSKS